MFWHDIYKQNKYFLYFIKISLHEISTRVRPQAILLRQKSVWESTYFGNVSGVFL